MYELFQFSSHQWWGEVPFWPSPLNHTCRSGSFVILTIISISLTHKSCHKSTHITFLQHVWANAGRFSSSSSGSRISKATRGKQALSFIKGGRAKMASCACIDPIISKLTIVWPFHIFHNDQIRSFTTNLDFMSHCIYIDCWMKLWIVWFWLLPQFTYRLQEDWEQRSENLKVFTACVT